VAGSTLADHSGAGGTDTPWNWNNVLTPRAVLRILPVAGLIAWAYWTPLTLWEAQWRTQGGTWGHGYLIPVIAVLIAHYRLQERAPRRIERCPWGLLFILVGSVMRIASSALRHGYPGQVTFVIVVAGALLWLLGWEMFKTLWVSAAYLLLMIPWEQKYYEDIALPLQRLSAMATEMMLRLVGLSVERQGNVLILPSGPLTVAGACSGLHLLFAFVALGVMMAFICRRPWWERLVIVASSFPIAVFCNFVRVTLVAIVSEHLFFARRAMEAGETTWLARFFDDPAKVESIRRTILDPGSFAHQSFGYVMLGLAFLLMWLELGFLKRLFVTETDEEAQEGAGRARPESAEGG